MEVYVLTRSAAKQRANKGHFGWRRKDGEDTTVATQTKPRNQVRGVRTPDGVFDSVAAAAANFGYTESRVAHVVEQRILGWAWVETDGCGKVLREFGLGQSVNGAVAHNGGAFSTAAEAAAERLAA